MQNLGVNKVHYGLCENAQCPFRTFTTKNPAFFIFFIFPSLCWVQTFATYAYSCCWFVFLLKKPTPIMHAKVVLNQQNLDFCMTFFILPFFCQIGVHLWIYLKFWIIKSSSPRLWACLLSSSLTSFVLQQESNRLGLILPQRF